MATSEVKFFKTRREMEVGDFHSLKSRGGERRVKAAVKIPMSNRPNKGTPAWILDGYQFVVKDDSPYNKMVCKDVKYEGMSVSFFTSEDGVRKMAGVGGLDSCTMDRFVVERVGDSEKALVFLSFVIYAPCGKDIIGWFYDHQGGTVYAEFDTTQATLSYGGEEDEEDEDDGQEDLPLSDAKAADPNDDPTKPIPGDKRQAIKPTDKPSARSAPKKGKGPALVN
jgi:hypothetical protein